MQLLRYRKYLCGAFCRGACMGRWRGQAHTSRRVSRHGQTALIPLPTTPNTVHPSAAGFRVEFRLIERAIQRGLDCAWVITEHHYQWPQAELDELLARANAPGFLLLSAFEYSSAKGDILIYGLQPEQVQDFVPGRDPVKMLAQAQALGGLYRGTPWMRAEISFNEPVGDAL